MITETEAAELFRRPPDRFVDVGAGSAAVRSVGTGPDVLFVHGWPVSGATFRRLLPHLADHVTCHVVDLPGAGWSQFGPGDEISLGRHVESVRRLVGEFDRPAVVAHDSGGLVARHAVAGDERVRALGLVDTEPLRLGWRFRSFIATRRLPALTPGLAWIAGRPAVYRNPLVFGSAFADRAHLEGEFAEFFLRPLHEDRARTEAATRLLRAWDDSLVDRLPEIHARLELPVRLVWGTEDAFFPIAAAREMVDSFPDAELVEIEGAGLFSHEEAPERVAAALLPLLVG